MCGELERRHLPAERPPERRGRRDGETEVERLHRLLHGDGGRVWRLYAFGIQHPEFSTLVGWAEAPLSAVRRSLVDFEVKVNVERGTVQVLGRKLDALPSGWNPPALPPGTLEITSADPEWLFGGYRPSESDQPGPSRSD